MPRFPISQSEIRDNQVSISGADYRHIIKVLRLKEGSALTLFDASGGEHSGIITEVNSKEIRIVITETKRATTESALNITLLQGIPKGDKMDMIIEKATELGVKKIVPVITERSQVRNTEKTTRWKRIALEASKQCGRFIPPHVEDPLNFDQAIHYNYNRHLKVILHEKYQDNIKVILNSSLQSTDNIAIFIGPEGGFSAMEVKTAEDKGFITMGLGPRILRTETAGIVTIAIMQFVYGDL